MIEKIINKQVLEADLPSNVQTSMLKRYSAKAVLPDMSQEREMKRLAKNYSGMFELNTNGDITMNIND